MRRLAGTESMLRTASIAALLLAVLAAALAGCGSSSGGTTGEGAPTSGAPQGATARICRGATALKDEVRVTAVGCGEGRRVVTAWNGKAKCHSPAGASRFSCEVAGYRCVAASADLGIAVACAKPGASLAFVSRR